MPISTRSRARPAIAIVGPALVRHLVFFYPARRNTRSEKEAFDGETAKQFLRQYCKTVISSVIIEDPEIQSFIEIETSFNESLEKHGSFVINLGKNICGLALRLQIVLYAEHFSITYFIDNDGLDSKYNSPGEFVRFLSDRLGNEIDPTHLFYRAIWNYLDDKLCFSAIFNSDWHNALRGDSRGFVITLGKTKNVTDKADVDFIIDPPGQRGVHWRSTILKTFLDENISLYLKILGVASFRHPISGYQPHARWDSNHILCTFLDGAALYGAAIANDDDDNSGRIGNYFVVTNDVNTNRVGRLIRRLNVLTDLRVLAFVDRRRVTGLGKRIRECGDALSTELDLLSQSKDNLRADKVNEIVRMYNEIGRTRWKTDPPADEIPHGGLVYRANRSKYYFDAFLSRLSDLSEEEIDGSQSYARYVIRNYKQPLESIKSVHERYMQLGSRIDRMISVVHTLQQRRTTQISMMIPILLATVPIYLALQSASTPEISKILVSSVSTLFFAFLIYQVLKYAQTR